MIQVLVVTGGGCLKDPGAGKNTVVKGPQKMSFIDWGKLKED